MNYLKLYENIISSTMTDNRVKGGDVYYESHHIIPKCIGKFNDTVLLTGREHFLCHWLLTKIFPEHHGLSHAFWSMCNGSGRKVIQERKYNITSKTYEIARIKHAVNVGERSIGREVSDETRAKIGNANRGKVRSSEVKEKMSISRINREYQLSHNKESKEKIGESRKNKSIYFFFNIITNEIFEGIVYDFYTKYGYGKVIAANLVKEKTKILDRSWVIV